MPCCQARAHADVLAKLRRGIQFDALQNPENQEILRGRAAASHAIPYRELDETQQRALFSHSKGIPVWKGRSFNQYAPHGSPAGFAVWDDVSFIRTAEADAISRLQADVPNGLPCRSQRPIR